MSAAKRAARFVQLYTDDTAKQQDCILALRYYARQLGLTTDFDQFTLQSDRLIAGKAIDINAEASTALPGYDPKSMEELSASTGGVCHNCGRKIPFFGLSICDECIDIKAND